MGMFFINLLGFIAILSLIVFLISVTFRVLPEEAKNALLRKKVSLKWKRIIETMGTYPDITKAHVVKTKTNVPEDVMEALEEYIRACLETRSVSEFEDIDLAPGYVVNDVRYIVKDNVLKLIVELKYGNKTIVLNPNRMLVEKTVVDLT